MNDAFGTRITEETLKLSEYLDQSSFDEKFVIDLVNDEIYNIYHVENKYYVPVMKGRYREMFEYAKKNMIHPSDQKFHDLLDPTILCERMAENFNNGMIKDECRERLVDGSYRWVQYFGVFGEQNGVPSGKVYFYVFDIQNQKDRIEGKSASALSAFDRDGKTGLWNVDMFFREAARKIEHDPGKWCCVAIDIQHFKVFSEWFGHLKASYVIAQIGSFLRDFECDESESRSSAVAGYFGRDNFGVFLKHDPKLIRELYDGVRDILFTYSNTVGFLPAIGVSILEDNHMVSVELYDRARMAVARAKENYTDRIRYYNPNEYFNKKKEYEMLTDLQRAMKNGEIGFFLQPQCHISTGKIVGAEALARWTRSNGEVASPGVFVPFLEENGFITDIDKCVWEMVCIWIRKCLDEGLTMVPISINISQVDILSMDVSAYLYGLTERYNIPARLLKAEITESAYAENFEKISCAVASLKEKGFQVLMDDFGSGYSSLNMLDNINTDVLKLDMEFMRKNTSMSRKGISIVESIISMTKTLNMPIIIEGVETAEQVSFLRTLGCRYAQGYYYHKPMPVKKFEQLISNREILDLSGIKNRPTELFHTREFLDENQFTDTMLNNILGPVAFYTLDKYGHLNITRFNQQFYLCIGDAKMETRRNCIQDFVVREDHPKLYKMLEDAVNDEVNGGECTIRFWKSDGGVFWYNMHLFFLRENEQGKIFYGKIAECTQMYQQGLAFFNILRMNSDYGLRIDLDLNLLFEIREGKPFDDPKARSMEVIESLTQTAKMHIRTEEKQKQFIEFFHPDRLRRSHQNGTYVEKFTTEFLMGNSYRETDFAAYYIRFMPDGASNVYVFAKAKEM